MNFTFRFLEQNEIFECVEHIISDDSSGTRQQAAGSTPSEPTSIQAFLQAFHSRRLRGSTVSFGKVSSGLSRLCALDCIDLPSCLNRRKNVRLAMIQTCHRTRNSDSFGYFSVAALIRSAPL